MATILVTGGAGFIGSCYVLAQCAAGDTVINLDKLTYSGNPENVASLSGNPRHIFVHGDIGNAELMEHLLKAYRPNAVVNFAAESHVERSILDPEALVCTNILGIWHAFAHRQSLVERIGRQQKSRLSLPACLHGRGVRGTSARRSGLHGNNAIYPK